ncbi:MAG: DUF2752 domain-containing protein [Bacteroidales bacterium]|nr:DUF2752 domain-containing protein [Bacteroidales bacterium]
MSITVIAGIIEWLENHQLPCFYKEAFGVECPGCGMQTALILLLKGDLIASFYAYPPLIPTIGMFGYLILHLIFKFKHGEMVLKFSFIFTFIGIIINYD